MTLKNSPSIGDFIYFGPLWAGDSGPTLDITLSYTNGGYVNLTNASIDINIRRWDPRRSRPIGPIITTGPGIISNATTGRLSYNWTYGDPVSTVPVEGGSYSMQLSVLFSNGNQQLTQRALFEVLSIV